MVLSLVSLFTGAGGLDIGLERSGFTTVAANDLNKHACATLRRNQSLRHHVPESAGHTHLAGTKVIEGDVSELAGRDFAPDDAGDDWRPDALVGGPPCQSFSSAGSQRSLEDPRGQLFREFVRLAQELRPRVILFENVRGLVTARGPAGIPGEAVNLIRGSFQEIGYATSFRVLNAADFGAPQRRFRMFMFAADRDAVLPDFLLPTHCRDGVGAKPWVTLREFFSGRAEPGEADTVRPSEALREQLEALPDGTGLRSPGRAEPTRPSGHWGYKQGTFIADPDLPARTVTGAATQDWVRRPGSGLRRITLREAAAIQGFPEQWEFTGSRSAQFQQVGNAVPTIFGEVLGLAMADALRKEAATPPVSAPFPQHMTGAIAYTSRDDAGNGVARPRSPRYISAFYLPDSGAGNGAIDTLSGGTWTPAKAPLPHGAATTVQPGYLNRIACPALGNCVAVGGYTRQDGSGQAGVA
jgi:DNA (cytosine-5)-methyltransferase 1